MAFLNVSLQLLMVVAVSLFPGAVLSAAPAHALPAVGSGHSSTQVTAVRQPDHLVAEPCPKLEVISPLLWYATDAEGTADADQLVDGYASGVIALAYGFRYKCVPARTIVGEVFYALDYSDDPAYTDDHFLPSDPKQGGYYWTLTLKDKEPFPDGVYRVEFYLDDEMIVAGEASVGGSTTHIVGHAERIEGEATVEAEETSESTPRPTQPRPTPTMEEVEPTETLEAVETEEPTRRPTRPRPTPTEVEPEPTATPRPTRPPDNKVQIDGTILDGATGRPIAGAVFVVLQPGISASQWADYGFPPSDIFSSSKTDRNGKFRHPGLEYNVEYSVIAWALSYQGWWRDGFMLTESDPDPYSLTIELYR
jgi:hypothetical protein